MSIVSHVENRNHYVWNRRRIDWSGRIRIPSADANHPDTPLVVDDAHADVDADADSAADVDSCRPYVLSSLPVDSSPPPPLEYVASSSVVESVVATSASVDSSP